MRNTEYINITLSKDEAEYILDNMYSFLEGLYPGEVPEDVDIGKVDISVFNPDNALLVEEIKLNQSIIKKLNEVL